MVESWLLQRKRIGSVVTLACTECKERTYMTEKNRKNTQARLEIQKYCPRCRKHQKHRETK